MLADLKEQALSTMGPIEKISALKVWWWAQREIPKMFQVWMQNAKVAWVVTSIGVLSGLFAGACISGQEVFAHETCASILAATTMVNGFLNVIGAGPRGVAIPKPATK